MDIASFIFKGIIYNLTFFYATWKQIGFFIKIGSINEQEMYLPWLGISPPSLWLSAVADINPESSKCNKYLQNYKGKQYYYFVNNSEEVKRKKEFAFFGEWNPGN